MYKSKIKEATYFQCTILFCKCLLKVILFYLCYTFSVSKKINLPFFRSDEWGPGDDVTMVTPSSTAETTRPHIT